MTSPSAVASASSSFRVPFPANRALLATMACIAVIGTRWPIAPPFLFDYDNVNFALALEEFAPLIEQPHRGYPLYVGVSRIVHSFGLSPEWTAMVMGLIGSVLALMFLIPLANEMFGRRAAWIAPLLLFCHPTFIMAGALDHVRTFLAAGAIATALYIWRGQLKTAALVLGIAGGFRTELTPTLLPLLILSPLLLDRVSWKRLIAPLAILTATVAPWLLFTLFKSGGLFTGMHYNSVMLRDNARSFFYEGFTHRATIMALFATYWNGIGALGWLWAVPTAIRRGFLADRRRHLLFLAIWFLPPYLLSAAIQVTDPDQTLASMAATCLVGAWALNAVGNRGTLLACAVNIGVFLFPIVPMGREASLPWIRRVIAAESNAMAAIAQTPGPRFITVQGDYPTARLLSYYFPNDWFEQHGESRHNNKKNAAPPRLGVPSRLTVDSQGNVSRTQ